jgi:hypothetical protein
MKRLFAHGVLFVFVVAAGGCAGVTHERIAQAPLPFTADGKGIDESAVGDVKTANARRDEGFKGVRYYGTSLYLLVYSDGKGDIVWKILELPDQTILMSARPYNVLARLEVQMTFVNGSLNRTAQLVDGTVVPRALIEAAAKVAPLLAPFDAAKTYTVPAPRLFKIVPTLAGYDFIGSPALGEINVTVSGGGN